MRQLSGGGEFFTVPVSPVPLPKIDTFHQSGKVFDLLPAAKS
jgi:hypothetical protein